MFRWIWLEVKYRRTSVYGESSNFSLTLIILASSLMLIPEFKRAGQNGGKEADSA